MLNRRNPFDVSGAVALGPLMLKEFDQLFRDFSTTAAREGTREFVPHADIF